MTESTQKPSITVDGVAYEIESLSPQVKSMVAMYQQWNTQLATLQTEFTKTDLAVKALGAEIAKQVKASLEEAPVEVQEPVAVERAAPKKKK